MDNYYKSTFCPTIGIAFISERMQRNSPRTVISATHIALVIHHQNVCGTWPLTTQLNIKWPKWTVAAKSKHCLVRPTTTHIMKALHKQEIHIQVNEDSTNKSYMFICMKTVNMLQVNEGNVKTWNNKRKLQMNEDNKNIN